jgi:RNA-binding protein YlmH
MLDREKYISYIQGKEEILFVNHFLDIIEKVLRKEKIQYTNFLDIYKIKIASEIIKQIDDVNYLIDGGYKTAERKRIVIFPNYLYPEHLKTRVSIIKIGGNFKFQNLTHRDFLGSLLSLGIKREKIGDILILKNYAQLILAEEIKDYIILNLNMVKRTAVNNIREISSDEIIIPNEKTRDIYTSVASMRLDAVACAGFGISRNKIIREIKNDKLKLNWKSELNPARKVEINDIFSIKGRGRIRISNYLGKTHKGRIKVHLIKYI